MQRLRTTADRLTTTPWPLLILGDSGTGKSAFAREVHARSGRPGEFVKLSARGVTDETLLAELAGHSDGAFTGARRSRKGLLETANHGTFFLDELGVASPALQQLLLQLVEDADVRRMGEERPRPLDVRFIAATNEPLDRAVAEGRFRADLLGRFRFFTLTMPPLSQRRDEIIPLANLFLQEAASRLGCPASTLTAEAAATLKQAQWRGNIRELQAACRYAAACSRGRSITVADLPAGLQGKEKGLTAEQAIAWRDEANGNLAQAARNHDYSDRQLRRAIAGSSRRKPGAS